MNDDGSMGDCGALPIFPGQFSLFGELYFFVGEYCREPPDLAGLLSAGCTRLIESAATPSLASRREAAEDTFSAVLVTSFVGVSGAPAGTQLGRSLKVSSPSLIPAEGIL